MRRNHFLSASLACAMCAAAGCASTTPELDRQFGQSVSLLNALQTRHPDAARNSDPVNGMDGKAAKSAYDAYQKSYQTPEPQSNAFTIGVGGR